MRALLFLVTTSLFAAPALAGDLGIIRLDPESLATAKALAERDVDMSFLDDEGLQRAAADLGESISRNNQANGAGAVANGGDIRFSDPQGGQLYRSLTLD